MKDNSCNKNSALSNVFCDIAGTLVIKESGSTDYQVNEDVVSFLRFLKSNYETEITLCSRVKGNALAPIYLTEEFTPIIEKAVLASQMLDVLIDNNPAEYLNAKFKIPPENLKGFVDLSYEKKCAFIQNLEKSSGFSFLPKTLS